MNKWSYDLPHITDKQKEILKLIHKFRFLNRIQIQTLMKHKDYKRINVWLKDLVGKDYLSRIYERKIPLNIKPAVYFLAPTGVRFSNAFADTETNHKLYREKQRSEEFRNKCILLANFYIDTQQKTEQLNVLNYFKTKQQLEIYDDIIKPYPDGLISLKAPPIVVYNYLTKKNKLTTTLRKIKKHQNNNENWVYYLELINEKAPRFYLRYRVKQYFEYADSKKLNKRTFVLFILPNDLTQKFLLKFIEKEFEDALFELNIKFAATTTDLFQNNGLFAGIWTGIQRQ